MTRKISVMIRVGDWVFLNGHLLRTVEVRNKKYKWPAVKCIFCGKYDYQCQSPS